MAMQRNREQDDGMITKVVSINRVSKTVKGGRVMKFAALIVVGDGKGTVGYGLGKAAEVSEAIQKGIANAQIAECVGTVQEMVNTSINVVNAEAQLARIPEGLA